MHITLLGLSGPNIHSNQTLSTLSEHFIRYLLVSYSEVLTGFGLFLMFIRISY